jgi:GTP cyclohydrolase II
MPVERVISILDQVVEVLRSAPAYRRRTGRPFVTLSYAQSLDGSIADRPGHPLALSGPQSLALTHSLRASHEAILVGIGTVLADNPRLNVRLVAGQDPQPIVVDSRLRFPPYANLLKNRPSPWIATNEGVVDAERQQALEAAGARILPLPGINGWVDLAALLKNLGSMGISSLMVEGGAQIITSFLTTRLVDQVVLTIAPLLVGGLRVVDHLGHSRRRLPRLINLSYQQLGDDLVLRGDPAWES